jgi:hypothetical protein
VLLNAMEAGLIINLRYQRPFTIELFFLIYPFTICQIINLLTCVADF